MKTLIAIMLLAAFAASSVMLPTTARPRPPKRSWRRGQESFMKKCMADAAVQAVRVKQPPIRRNLLAPRAPVSQEVRRRCQGKDATLPARRRPARRSWPAPPRTVSSRSALPTPRRPTDFLTVSVSP